MTQKFLNLTHNGESSLGRKSRLEDTNLQNSGIHNFSFNWNYLFYSLDSIGLEELEMLRSFIGSGIPLEDIVDFIDSVILSKSYRINSENGKRSIWNDFFQKCKTICSINSRIGSKMSFKKEIKIPPKSYYTLEFPARTFSLSADDFNFRGQFKSNNPVSIYVVSQEGMEEYSKGKIPFKKIEGSINQTNYKIVTPYLNEPWYILVINQNDNPVEINYTFD